jgi:hypothetical protein
VKAVRVGGRSAEAMGRSDAPVSLTRGDRWMGYPSMSYPPGHSRRASVLWRRCKLEGKIT